MEPGQLRIDVQQLPSTAGQWSKRNTELAVLEPPSPGPPFQPNTAAVGSAHEAVDAASAALTTHATASAAEAGAMGYVSNETTAAAEMAAVAARLE
ncbi:hypothetical protein ACX9NE_24925 [Mycobacterium sp. ML4]